MDLSDGAFERLKKLKDRADATSYSEVMKDALRLYEFVLEKEQDGSRFFVQDKDTQAPMAELKMFV
jgi:predicted CopG family antitoxin